ncbi:cyclic nucleotide-binding domain-containing protein [Thiorhodococcus minor]|uniref:cyclic nucleotide-binding domain-containing protein n=1 Tax=Thiorhodococcus minor TaxID=57489 RepID=UPI001ADC92FB|nr:cyclic nucleotide-binding domain-containing protein [Thiorhodococcus minor]
MTQIEGLERLLAEHPFFRDMSQRARDLIAGCAANRVFHDGERLLREGDQADVFYLVRHGAVAVEVQAPGRKPLVLETLGDGEVLGWSWLVPPYRVQFDGRAVGLVRALAMDAKCLRGKCAKDPALGYEFLSHFVGVMAERLTAARLQMLDIYGHPGDYMEMSQGLTGEDSAPAKPSPTGG